MLPTQDWYLLGILNSKCAEEYLSQLCSQLLGGVIEFRDIYLVKLPIPCASQSEKETIAILAQRAQSYHMERRKRVEKFLREIDIDPAHSSTRNPLEQPWTLSKEEFTRTRQVRPTGYIYGDAR